MTSLLARTVFPLSVLVGAALWIGGYHGVGDGFSAGAVAGIGAILQHVSHDHANASRRVGGRWAFQLLAVGLLVVLAVVCLPVFVGAPPATHLPAPGEHVAKLGGLEAHTALLFDLGVALAVYGALVASADRLFPPTREGE